MKVNHINLNAINVYRTQAAKPNTANGKASFKDTLEISTKAQQRQSTKTYAQHRSEKVAELKQQVNSGEYKVDAKKVAEDMLNYYRL